MKRGLSAGAVIVIGCGGAGGPGPAVAPPAPTTTSPAPSAPAGASSAPSATPEPGPVPSAAAAPAPGAEPPEPKLEQPEPGHVIVRAGAALLDCTAVHAAHAALTECRLRGPAGDATLAWGQSDDADRVLCSRKPQAYSWEHGGGWDAGAELFRTLGAQGARLVLAPGVELWIAPKLEKLELSSGKRTIELEVDLEGSKIATRSGTGAPRTSAKLMLDLGEATKSPASCSSDP